MIRIYTSKVKYESSRIIYKLYRKENRENFEKEDAEKYIFTAIFYYALAIILLNFSLAVLVIFQYHRTIYNYFYWEKD